MLKVIMKRLIRVLVIALTRGHLTRSEAEYGMKGLMLVCLLGIGCIYVLGAYLGY